MPVPPQTSPINWESWGSVRSFIDKAWDPKNHPHHSIVGLTGSGKSYLAVNGILSLCEWDRVLIIDTKKDDDTISSIGKPVYEIPKDPWGMPWYYRFMKKQENPRDHWFRLMVDDNPAKARPQVRNALSRVYNDGNWVVYIDELFDITGRQAPSLNLGPYVEHIYRKGRYKKVSVVAATQTPVSVPRVFYDQASFAWLGRIRDEERQKRLIEIGGMSKSELHHISTLKSRQWLLSAMNGEYFAKTQVRI